MLDHKKKAITEHWQFCPKCNLKLYRMTADCTGFIHIKCWRCRKMLWLDLSIRAKRYSQHRQSEIQRQYPGYSGAAECPPVCHQAAGYHRPVHLGKPQDRLALQSHPFPGCIPQISGRSGRCPLAHAAQLPPHLCVADAGVGRGYSDHPEHRRPCRHRDD